MAYQGPDGRWYAGSPGDYANTHGQNRNQSGGGGNPGAPGTTAPKSDPIMDILNQRTAAQQAFYQNQMGQAIRGISAQYTPQRSAILQALESRGLGRSSEVGRSLGALAGQEAMRGQEAMGDIQAQAFAGNQQMWNMYLNYLLQRKLQKDGNGGIWDLFEGIGSAIPYLGGGRSASSGGVDYGQPAGSTDTSGNYG